MAIFHVYLDDSGKFADSDYTCLCGYVGKASEWERFSERWDSFRFENSLPPVHMKDIMAFNDEWLKKKKSWGGKPEDERDRVLLKLARIVKTLNKALGGGIGASLLFGLAIS